MERNLSVSIEARTGTGLRGTTPQMKLGNSHRVQRKSNEVCPPVTNAQKDDLTKEFVRLKTPHHFLSTTATLLLIVYFVAAHLTGRQNLAS